MTSRALLFGLPVLLLLGCGSSTTSVVNPLGPASIRIAELQPSGGPAWTPGASSCVELGRDSEQTIGVKIGLDNWTLRPPGACGGAPQCGYVRLQVDPQGGTSRLEASAAAELIPAKMAAISDPLGSHTFQVELLNDQGKPAHDAHRQPLAARVTVRVAAPGQCAQPIDGGQDAPLDATVDAPNDAPLDGTADAPLDGTADAPLDTLGDGRSDASNEAALDAPGGDAQVADGGAD